MKWAKLCCSFHEIRTGEFEDQMFECKFAHFMKYAILARMIERKDEKGVTETGLAYSD